MAAMARESSLSCGLAIAIESMPQHRPQRYARRRRPTLNWTSFAAGIVCGGLLTFVAALLPGLFGTKSEAPASSPAAGPALAAAPTPAAPKFEFFDSLPKND